MVGGAVLDLYIQFKSVFKLGGEGRWVRKKKRKYKRDVHAREVSQVHHQRRSKFTTVLRMHVYVLGRHATNTMDDSMWLDALCCEAQSRCEGSQLRRENHLLTIK